MLVVELAVPGPRLTAMGSAHLWLDASGRVVAHPASVAFGAPRWVTDADLAGAITRQAEVAVTPALVALEALATGRGRAHQGRLVLPARGSVEEAA